MIELRYLRYFVAVAEELHFGHAALRLHIAQPALSQRIRALEESLGVQLLQRSRRGVVLTNAGAVLLEEGRQILERLEHAEQLTSMAAHGEVGRLAIGCVLSATYKILPGLLREYTRRFPKVIVTVRDLGSSAQIEELRRGEIDVAIVRTPVDTKGLAARKISEDRIAILMPGNHRLAKCKEIPLKALTEERLIVFPVSRQLSWADKIFSICRQAGFEPKVAQRAGEAATAMSFVAAGLGITLVPESLTACVPKGVVCRPVLEPTYSTHFLVAHRKKPISETLKGILSVISDLWPQHEAVP